MNSLENQFKNSIQPKERSHLKIALYIYDSMFFMKDVLSCLRSVLRFDFKAWPMHYTLYPVLTQKHSKEVNCITMAM